MQLFLITNALHESNVFGDKAATAADYDSDDNDDNDYMIALFILFLEIRKWKIPSHFYNAAHGMVLPWQTLFSPGSCGLWGSVWPSACKLQSEKEPIAKLCLRLL